MKSIVAIHLLGAAPAILIGLAHPLAAAEPAAKPNILWVVTDDQRMDSIAAFNRLTIGQDDSRLGKVMSPNVDRLTTMGTTYINTFNQNPSCAPSRTSMHTGRYSHRTGVYGFEYYNPTGMDHWRPMVPQVLESTGYQTVTVGKRGIRLNGLPKPGEPGGLYQIDLGYRNEFEAKGLVDWNKKTDWKTKANTETFYFPDGQKLVWPEDTTVEPNDLAEIKKRLDIFKKYTPGKPSEGTEILGGVSSQPGDKTRDGSFAGALALHLQHPNESYKTLLGKKIAGPDTSKPLFAYVGFDVPHTPVLPPEEFRKQFSGLKYKVPVLTPEELASFPPQIQKLFSQSGSNHFTDAEKQQMISDYFAFCAYGDSLVGKVVDDFIAFSEKSSRPWLVLYVCGDHGWRLNEHGMISKFGPFDIDLHNPIIVVSSDKKKFPANKVVTDFACFVDMAPTFFAAAGIDITKPEYDHLDGKDLAKLASGEQPARDYIIAEPTHVIGPRAVIRSKEYKFSMRIRPIRIDGKKLDWAIKAPLEDIEPMFFDLKTDPAEIHNLASDPHYRPVLNAMRKKLQDIVLGDGRIEVKWTKQGGENVVVSNFAPGADDGKLTLPDLKSKP